MKAKFINEIPSYRDYSKAYLKMNKFMKKDFEKELNLVLDDDDIMPSDKLEQIEYLIHEMCLDFDSMRYYFPPNGTVYGLAKYILFNI